jgi:hypothetical protein
MPTTFFFFASPYVFNLLKGVGEGSGGGLLAGGRGVGEGTGLDLGFEGLHRV